MLPQDAAGEWRGSEPRVRKIGRLPSMGGAPRVSQSPVRRSPARRESRTTLTPLFSHTLDEVAGESPLTGGGLQDLDIPSHVRALRYSSGSLAGPGAEQDEDEDEEDDDYVESGSDMDMDDEMAEGDEEQDDGAENAVGYEEEVQHEEEPEPEREEPPPPPRRSLPVGRTPGRTPGRTLGRTPGRTPGQAPVRALWRTPGPARTERPPPAPEPSPYDTIDFDKITDPFTDTRRAFMRGDAQAPPPPRTQLSPSAEPARPPLAERTEEVTERAKEPQERPAAEPTPSESRRASSAAQPAAPEPRLRDSGSERSLSSARPSLSHRASLGPRASLGRPSEPRPTPESRPSVDPRTSIGPRPSIGSRPSTGARPSVGTSRLSAGSASRSEESRLSGHRRSLAPRPSIPAADTIVEDEEEVPEPAGSAPAPRPARPSIRPRDSVAAAMAANEAPRSPGQSRSNRLLTQELLTWKRKYHALEDELDGARERAEAAEQNAESWAEDCARLERQVDELQQGRERDRKAMRQRVRALETHIAETKMEYDSRYWNLLTSSSDAGDAPDAVQLVVSRNEITRLQGIEADLRRSLCATREQAAFLIGLYKWRASQRSAPPPDSSRTEELEAQIARLTNRASILEQRLEHEIAARRAAQRQLGRPSEGAAETRELSAGVLDDSVEEVDEQVPSPAALAQQPPAPAAPSGSSPAAAPAPRPRVRCCPPHTPTDLQGRPRKKPPVEAAPSSSPASRAHTLESFGISYDARPEAEPEQAGREPGAEPEAPAPAEPAPASDERAEPAMEPPMEELTTLEHGQSPSPPPPADLDLAELDADTTPMLELPGARGDAAHAAEGAQASPAVRKKRRKLLGQGPGFFRLNEVRTHA